MYELIGCCCCSRRYCRYCRCFRYYSCAVLLLSPYNIHIYTWYTITLVVGRFCYSDGGDGVDSAPILVVVVLLSLLVILKVLVFITIVFCFFGDVF